MRKPESSQITVLGVARNIEFKIAHEIRRIDKSLKNFKRVNYIIVESFSNDKTLDKLKILKSRYINFDFESITDFGDTLNSFRSYRLAAARNTALQIAKSKYASADYIFVCDLDGVNRDLTEASVLSNWKYSHWTMMSANQPGGYYDILALIQPYWNSIPYGQQMSELSKYMSDKNVKQLGLFSKSICIDKTDPIIPVQSSFGGGAIYKSENYFEQNYVGLDINMQQVCEHLSVNLNLSNCGNELFINPAFINVRYLGRSRTFRERLLRKLGRELPANPKL